MSLPIVAIAMLIGTANMPVAQATMMKALSLDALVTQSTDIVRASAISKSSHFDAYNQIVTDYVMKVHHAVKGRKAKNSTIVVRSLGGIVGDLGMHVAGAPQFEQNKEYMLFLRGRGRHHQVVGMSQGVMLVAKVKGVSTVYPGGAGVSLVQRNGKSVSVTQSALTVPTKTKTVVKRIRQIQRVHKLRKHNKTR